jgi:hypothetical protein
VTRLEDELRATFAIRVADVPMVRDRAGTAIARGRAARRRHRVVAGAAVFLVVALMASGTWWVRGTRPDGPPRAGVVAGPGPSGSARPAYGSLRLDFVVGGELRPAGGRPIALPGSGDVYDAVRVSEGWLVVRGDKTTHKLWLVRPGGASTLLLDALPSVFAFSRYNVIAYQQGSTVTVTSFDFAKGKAYVKATFQLPGQDGSQGRTGAELVGWAGGAHLVIGNRVGIDYNGFDLLRVDSQSYTPAFNPAVLGVYAATPDDRLVVGAVRNPSTGQTCAATLDPAAGFTIVQRVCGQPYLSLGRRALSPDGRRILGRVDRGIGIADATTGVLITKVPAAEGAWPAEPVWVDAGTFVIAEKDRLLYVDVVDPAHPRQLPLPSTSEPWLVVAGAGA